jgi:hypothetical protein
MATPRRSPGAGRFSGRRRTGPHHRLVVLQDGKPVRSFDGDLYDGVTSWSFIQTEDSRHPALVPGDYEVEVDGAPRRAHLIVTNRRVVASNFFVAAG